MLNDIPAGQLLCPWLCVPSDMVTRVVIHCITSLFFFLSFSCFGIGAQKQKQKNTKQQLKKNTPQRLAP